MLIRRFEQSDAEEVSELISTTMMISNIKDYSKETMDTVVSRQKPENILERAGWTHFYVVVDDKRIIGCGAIGSFWGKEDESSLFSIFVLPEYQGKGIGRKIIETLEQDEYFSRAKRIEIPSSVTAVNFYKKMGYNYKNGISEPDEEQVVRLEKFR